MKHLTKFEDFQINESKYIRYELQRVGQEINETLTTTKRILANLTEEQKEEIAEYLDGLIETLNLADKQAGIIRKKAQSLI